MWDIQLYIYTYVNIIGRTSLHVLVCTWTMPRHCKWFLGTTVMLSTPRHENLHQTPKNRVTFRALQAVNVAFPQFGATIIYQDLPSWRTVYSWQASTSAETVFCATIAGHPATPEWPPCRHVMHLERFLKTADEVGVIPLDELDGSHSSHISKSAIKGGTTLGVSRPTTY